MSKKIKFAILASALASIVAVSASASACTIKTSHPRAKITISFNEVTYDLEYTLYRNMYPQTVQHFIELADAGFYNDTIIHNYTTNDWFAGAYGYDEADFNDLTKSEYLEEHSKEQAYYDLAENGLTPTVYQKTVYDKNGNPQVADSDKLATLIGEFSANGHNIENGALSANLGSLKMFYYSKGDSKKKATVLNSFGEVHERDYLYNCATSVFMMQVGSSTSYSATNYCVFGVYTENTQNVLDDLKDAISDYITDELGGSTSKFSSSVSAQVDNLDAFAEDGGRGIETTFTMTTVPLIIKTVKITKY